MIDKIFGLAFLLAIGASIGAANAEHALTISLFALGAAGAHIILPSKWLPFRKVPGVVAFAGLGTAVILTPVIRQALVTDVNRQQTQVQNSDLGDSDPTAYLERLRSEDTSKWLEALKKIDPERYRVEHERFTAENRIEMARERFDEQRRNPQRFLRIEKSSWRKVVWVW